MKIATVALVVCAFFPVAASASFTTSASSATTLSKGLVGYWTFDGNDTPWTSAIAATTLDKSGNNNTGTLTSMNQSTSPTIGKIGQGLKFDGVDDYVDIGTTNLLTGAHTVAFWAKPVANITQSFGEIKLDNLGFILYNYLGGVSFGHRGGIGSVTPNDGSITGGVWSHIVVIYSGGDKGLLTSYSIYINGVQKTTSSTGTVGAGYSRNFFGKEGNGSPFNGLLDDVRIYSRALSANEVAQLYNLGKITKDASPVTTLKTGLVGYWTFDGKDTPWTSATAATTLDKSGNNNTGTLTSMNRATTPAIGKVGQGLKFNGAGDAVNIGVLSPVGAATYSAWVYSTGDGANYRAIFANWTPTNVVFIGQEISAPTSLTVYFNGALIHTTPNFFSPNTWVHLVVSHTGSNVTTYKNGVLFAGPFASTLTAPVGVTSVGGDIGRNNYYWKGKIDDARIYSRALSANEVAQLYNVGKITKNASPVGSLTKGLVGYWTFDGNDTPWTSATEGTTKDLSGNNNTGTLTSMSRATSPIVGKVGQALLFDGSTQYMTVPTITGLSTSQTVVAWVKERALSAGMNNYVLDEGNNNHQVQVYDGDNSNGLPKLACNGQLPAEATETISKAGVWYQIVCVMRSDGTISAYINGTLDWSGSGTTPAPSTVSIGKYGADLLHNFDGSIDDVRIYNRALSANEVKQLYNIGR